MHQRDVAKWITEWIWQKPLGARGRHTIIAIDEDEDPPAFVGFGTWLHVHAISTVEARHIEIDWFGIDIAYQGRRDDAGQSVAGLIYATVEAAARGHEESTDDMPMTLVCHVDNERGRRFWERLGYSLVPDPHAQVEDDVYYRMVR